MWSVGGLQLFWKNVTSQGFNLKMMVVRSSEAVATIHHKITVLIFNSVSLIGSYICLKWLWHTRLCLGM